MVADQVIKIKPKMKIIKEKIGAIQLFVGFKIDCKTVIKKDKIPSREIKKPQRQGV
jgi:hypothetical protein